MVDNQLYFICLNWDFWGFFMKTWHINMAHINEGVKCFYPKDMMIFYFKHALMALFKINELLCDFREIP